MLISKKIGACIAPLLSVSIVFAEPPKRVVSVNLCTDQLAMTVSSPEQLISVSYLSRDPMSSAMWEEAQNYNINHGQIEELVLLEPDLVLAHEWTSPLLLSMLERFDIPYVQFSSANALDEVSPLILQMGAALGQDNRAANIVENFENRKTELLAQVNRQSHSPRIAAYGPNGWVGGATTLDADILAKSGFENISSEFGLDDGGFMPLEALVIANPDVVLTSTPWPKSSRGESLLAHPALAAVVDHTVEQPKSDASWDCGTPEILTALSQMVELSKQFAEGHR